jgi:uncharacterized alkaline shock family protein YloU
MIEVPLPAALAPPDQRGRLVIAKRVIEKIAAQAVTEVPGTGPARRISALGQVIDSAGRAKVDAQLDGAKAWLSVEVGLSYPTPLRAGADELRAHLTRRVEQLSGIAVRRLDIRVTWLSQVETLPKKLA